MVWMMGVDTFGSGCRFVHMAGFTRFEFGSEMCGLGEGLGHI